jgi:hypothetical protein
MEEIIAHNKIDELEVVLLEYPPVSCPLNHEFVPGMYIREIFMPKGTMITSVIHNIEHPYFIRTGLVSVWSENDGEQMLYTSNRGITKPGTRRVLYIHEDTVWVTVHRTDIRPKDDSEESVMEAVNLIMDEITEVRPNPILGKIFRNNIVIKNIEEPLNELT